VTAFWLDRPGIVVRFQAGAIDINFLQSIVTGLLSHTALVNGHRRLLVPGIKWPKGEAVHLHIHMPSWCDILFNPLKTKRILLYLKTQFVPRCKYVSSRL